jgi:hypothetical protein
MSATTKMQGLTIVPGFWSTSKPPLPPPPFSNYVFQLWLNYIIVANDLFDYNLFFFIVDHKSQQVQVEPKIVVESDGHMSTPQQ